MKSDSIHYQSPTEKKPDLLESIRTLEMQIAEHEGLEQKHHDEVVSKRSKLRSLLALKKKYEDLLSGVSDTIIHDEATDLNGVIRGDDESAESYMKCLELAGKTERE